MPIFQLIEGDLFCDGGDGVKATGHLEGQEILVVHSGSLARGSHGTSDLVRMKVVVDDGKWFRFVRDFPFPSPAAAAKVIRGHTVPGWTAWKNASGQTLSDLMKH